MLENAKPLFSLMGFQVKLDATWLLLAGLIIWSLAVGYFPEKVPALAPATYWFMGAACAIGIFFSIVFHELSHSVVARQFGIPIRGITLFIFGGVAEMEDVPTSAKGEFWMAIAGPIMSFFIAFICLLISNNLSNFTGPEAAAVLSYLARINFVVAIFNLLPGFPLDGGRILRSALWGWKNDFKWATNVATRIGNAISTGMIILALLNFISGNVIGGIWMFVIAIFLKMAAKNSQLQMLLKSHFSGHRVSEFMCRDLVTVPKNITLATLINDYLYKHYHKMYPVIDNDKPVGFITTQEVKKIPDNKRQSTLVSDIMLPINKTLCTSPNEDILKALKIMNSNGRSRLLVINNHRLLGIITLKDLMQFLSTKLELEDTESLV